MISSIVKKCQQRRTICVSAACAGKTGLASNQGVRNHSLVFQPKEYQQRKIRADLVLRSNQSVNVPYFDYDFLSVSVSLGSYRDLGHMQDYNFNHLQHQVTATCAKNLGSSKSKKSPY